MKKYKILRESISLLIIIALLGTVFIMSDNNIISANDNPVCAWEFTANVEGWTVGQHISGFAWQTGGYVGGSITANDPFIYSSDSLGVAITNAKTIKVRMKNSTTSTTAQIYFVTNSDPNYSEAKSKNFTTIANDSNYTEYTIDMSSIAGWTGTLKQLRVDPTTTVTTGSFSIDDIRIYENPPAIAWEYTSNAEGWSVGQQVTSFGWQTGGYLGGTITGTDPRIRSADSLGIAISNQKIVKIRMKNNSAATTGKVYFITNASTTFNDAKSKTFTLIPYDPNYTEYIIDFSDNTSFTGTLKRVRVHPGTDIGSGSFSIDYIRVVESLLDKNLTAWYKYNETSGTTAYDSSGNSKNATLVNGPTWASGKYNNSVKLDGINDHLTIPTGTLSSLNNFTISTWLNLETIDTWSRIFDFGTGTSVYMALTPKNGANGAIRYAITTNGPGSEQQINGTEPLSSGTWKHVAVTLSGSTGILYVDGKEVGRNTNMTLKPSNLGNTNLNYIGRSQWADPYLKGKIDEFRIYGRALSLSEIQILANIDTTPYGSLTGIDDLGRVLPDNEEVSAPRNDRYVGIFYFLWLGQHTSPGPYDITSIITQYPNAVNDGNHPAWGPMNAFHFYAEPLYNYYLADDAWVLRKHVQQLCDAGIDFIVFDATNGYTYKSVYDVMFQIMEEYRLKGFKVPKFTFYTNTDSGATVTSLYNDIYAQNRYPNLWFHWKGKPMIIGEPSECSGTIQNFFTFRLNQWPWTHEPQKINGFPWMDFVRPQRVFYNDEGEKEVINVSIAQHQDTVAMSDTPFYSYGTNWSRNWHNGAYDTSQGAVNWGYNFQEQWDFALEQDPQIIFITGWNEWIAQRLAARDQSRPLTFCDLATVEFSRDAEPIKGHYGDNYYMQIVDNVRRFKGAAKYNPPGAAKTITMNTTFSQWDDVTAVYRDYTGDTAARNHGGYGGVTYTNNTGRNDFDILKVAQDNDYIYFYAKTVNNITPYTDARWMRLYIDTDNNMQNGWKGYDYVVSRASTGRTSTATRIEACTGGWNWQLLGLVDYRMSGTEMHIKIPRSTIGLDNLNNPINIKFKWSDNMQNTSGDIMDFYVNGDVAPDGRYSYVYTVQP